MPLSYFTDKDVPPTEAALTSALGITAKLWIGLKKDLLETYAPLTEEWKYAGKAYGWGFRLKQAKRVLVYFTPGDGNFLVSFALGEKACAAAHTAGLPPAILDLIDAAPKYAEGRGVRIPVRTKADADGVRKLAAIKAAELSSNALVVRH